VLDKQQRELLKRMREDNISAGFPFVPLGWWEKVGEQFDTWFDEHGIADVTQQDYNRHFAGLGGQSALARYIEHLGGSLVEYEKLMKYTVGLLKCAIRRRYGVLLLSHLSPDANANWDTLTAHEALLAIGEVNRDIFDKPVTVADLGAGWGRVGWMLMQLNRQARYIIYDIPDSLIISHTYLNRLIPDLCHPYGELSGEPGVYFLGSQELANAQPADYLITIATTQEMEADHIAAYLDLIEKKTKWFYTLQRRQTGKHYRPEWKEHFNRSPLWADYHFEALFKMLP